MESQTVYEAFIAEANGPFEILQEWARSYQGYMYPISKPANSRGNYVMIFPLDVEVFLPPLGGVITVTLIGQVGPP